MKESQVINTLGVEDTVYWIHLRFKCKAIGCENDKSKSLLSKLIRHKFMACCVLKAILMREREQGQF